MHSHNVDVLLKSFTSLSSMSVLVLQTAAVTSLRVSVFFGCRKYLLRTIYHDLLQELRNPGSDGDAEDSEVELNPLPQPSTSAAKSVGKQTEFHSTLARSMFSLCFEESCVLFALLMCQGVGVLEPRYVHRVELIVRG